MSHRDRLFRDIQNLVDHHSHTAVAIVENNYLHGVSQLALVGHAWFQQSSERHQWKDAVPVLNYLPSARMLDGRKRELLEPGDERQWNSQTIERSGPEQQQPLLLYLGLRFLFVRRACRFT